MGEEATAVKLDEKLENLYSEITQLTVLEAAELVKAMEERLGVSAAAPVAMAMGPAGGGEAAAPVEEKTQFDVILKDAGAKKIQVIKAVREITSLGLKEAKGLVDGVPSKVSTGVSKDDAEAAKKKLEGEGATVEIQ